MIDGHSHIWTDSFKKIDAHSHIWTDSFWMEAPIEEYIKQATNMWIKKAFIMPVPSPITIKDNENILPCRWDEQDWEIRYFKKKLIKWQYEIIEENPKNPYKYLNEILIEKLKNNSNKSLEFYSVWLIHPKLDRLDYIKELCNNKNIYAVKIHGVWTFTWPDDVPDDFFKIIKDSWKPLVVHVDYHNKKPENFFDELLLLNNPVDWVKKWIKHGIKLYITHAAKFSKEAVELAKWNENIVFWMSPDLLIPQDINGIYSKEDNAIRWCLEKIPNKQLVFDIDYSWNAKEIWNWGELEWNSSNRITYEAKKIWISNNELKNIFYNNSIRYFNI